MSDNKADRLDVLQGTLDLLILRTLENGPMHGWAVSERIQQISQTSCASIKARSIPRCIAWSTKAGSKPNGASPNSAAARDSTTSPPPAENSWSAKQKIGGGSRQPSVVC